MARAGSQRGSLEQRDGQWILRLRQRQAEGGTRRVTLRVGPVSRLKTKAAARLEAERMLARKGAASPVAGTAIAFSAFAEIYLDELQVNKQPTTVAGYRSYIRRHLMPLFGATPLQEICGGRPAGAVSAMARAGLARATIRAAMAVLGRMLESAVQRGYAAVPLSRRLYDLPPPRPAKPMRFYTPEEAARIIEAADYPWRALFALMAYAGLRASEALGIEWRHVDLVNRQLHIRQAACLGKLKVVKSANSAADLPIPDALRSILLDFHGQVPHHGGLLFESPQGGPYWSQSVTRNHLTPILRRLQIPHGGLHAFRHGHATNLFASGAAAPVVRSMLRHGDIKTTLRYVHVTGADMREAARAAAERIVTTERRPAAETIE